MARCNCSPMCEKCCCGPCDCTCAAEQAKPDRSELIRETNYRLWMDGNGGCEPPPEWLSEQAQAGELPKRKESSDLAREQRERYLNSPEGLQWRQTVALERLAEKTTEQAEVLYGDDVKENGPWIRFSDHLAELAALRSRLAGGVTVDDAMVERALQAFSPTLWNYYPSTNYVAGDKECMRAALIAALGAK